MNVTLFTFSKKHNSTAVPTGGTSVDVVFKDEAGVLDPIIELHTSASPSAYNYLYIPTFGRYYWLREWTYNRGIWTGSFYVDPLASWKTQIGAQQLYVFRSAAEYDGKIIDNLYPTKADVEYNVRNITSPWSPAASSSTTGMFVISYAGYDGNVSHIAVNQSNLFTFFDALFSDDYMESVVDTTTLTPEIKAEIDPLKYVYSVKYYPCTFSTGIGSWGTIDYDHLQTSAQFYVGWGRATFQGGLTYGEFSGKYLSEMNLPITIDPITMGHPQINDRGYFLRSAPYTLWSLFLPPFGMIELPSDDMMEASELLLRIVTDVRNGDSQLIITGTVGTKTVTLATAGANVGVDIPITKAVITGGWGNNEYTWKQFTEFGISAVKSIATLNSEGLMSAYDKLLGNFAASQVPHTSSVGSVGSAAVLAGNPMLVAQYSILTDDDVAGRGRPLCSKRTLSAIPGYIQADPDELSIAASARELEEIRGFISGGFFYE